MKTIAIVLLLLAGCAESGAVSPAPEVTCQPCGDGSIVCNGSVAQCAADNGGTCMTNVGATAAAAFAFNADGSYSEVTTDGMTTGTWSVASAGSGIVLKPVGAVLGLYENICPYAMN